MRQLLAHMGGMFLSMAGTILIVVFASIVISGKPTGKILHCPLAYVSRVFERGIGSGIE
jgi:hypothetical protein